MQSKVDHREVFALFEKLAMSIEARALDLYQRAADRQPDKDGQVIQQQTVDEERSHQVQHCRLLEQVS